MVRREGRQSHSRSCYARTRSRSEFALCKSDLRAATNRGCESGMTLAAVLRRGAELRAASRLGKLGESADLLTSLFIRRDEADAVFDCVSGRFSRRVNDLCQYLNFQWQPPVVAQPIRCVRNGCRGALIRCVWASSRRVHMK